MTWTDSVIPNNASGREDALPSLAPQEREREDLGFFLPFASGRISEEGMRVG